MRFRSVNARLRNRPTCMATRENGPSEHRCQIAPVKRPLRRPKGRVLDPQRWTCAGARGALGVQCARFGRPLAADKPSLRGRYGPSRPGGPILETKGVYIQDVILPRTLW